MNERDLQDVESPSGPVRPRWGGLGITFSWLVILATIVLVVFGAALLASDGPETGTPRIGVQQELMGQLVVGFSQVDPAYAKQNAAALEKGSPLDQVAYAILIAAIDGPDAGDQALPVIGAADDPLVEESVPLVRKAFAAMRDAAEESPTATSRLTEFDRESLVEELGWFGELASALSDPPALRRIQESALVTMAILFAFVGGMIVVGGLGFIGLVVLIVMMASGNRSWRVLPTTSHAVYAETFAIWLVGFSLAGLAAAAVAPEDFRFAAGFLVFLGSLIVLIWPVLRGVPWSQVRADIGLTRFSMLDIPCGFATYAMSLPFLGVGVMITLFLQLVVTAADVDVSPPSHPAQDAMSGASGMLLVQLFLVAVVAAPLVEEILFRGVLYAHLRGATRTWQRFFSIAFAAVVSAAVFAIIHPQGPIFAPVLAGLAVGFCVGREWRGSIYASIVAHAVNNAIVLSLSVLLMG